MQNFLYLEDLNKCKPECSLFLKQGKWNILYSSISPLMILNKNCHLQPVYYESLILETEAVMNLVCYSLMSKTVPLGNNLFCSMKGTASAWSTFKDFVLMCMLLAIKKTFICYASAWHWIKSTLALSYLSGGGKIVDYFCPSSSDSLETMLNPVLCFSPIPSREGSDRYQVGSGGDEQQVSGLS